MILINDDDFKKIILHFTIHVYKTKINGKV